MLKTAMTAHGPQNVGRCSISANTAPGLISTLSSRTASLTIGMPPEAGMGTGVEMGVGEDMEILVGGRTKVGRVTVEVKKPSIARAPSARDVGDTYRAASGRNAASTPCPASAACQFVARILYVSTASA